MLNWVVCENRELLRLLKGHEIRISMGRVVGNPYDNAQAESFIKTLKYEEGYLFLEEAYNEKRFYSAMCHQRSLSSSWINEYQLNWLSQIGGSLQFAVGILVYTISCCRATSVVSLEKSTALAEATC